ncbi:hypothetical protein [Oryza sativa Japonica Group]|uniref:Uncharacterized protein n=1 Tax=Oryza sativa subsp. japonica TaxID=39947 RepID=Q5ZBS3_ORYSJ|nr:hypothetical protein [Oryza sativa Japonica Group]BAD68266.1 hypothetical protein [Oryza sativa Japonica Group]
MERRRRRYDVASGIGPPNYLRQRREGRGSDYSIPLADVHLRSGEQVSGTSAFDVLNREKAAIRFLGPPPRTYRTLTRTLPQAHVPSLQPASRRELYGSADADADARPTHTARFDSHAHAHALPAARGLSFKLPGAAAPSVYADTAKGRAVCPEQRAARWVAGWQAPLGTECSTKALLTVWGLGIG